MGWSAGRHVDHPCGGQISPWPARKVTNTVSVRRIGAACAVTRSPHKMSLPSVCAPLPETRRGPQNEFLTCSDKSFHSMCSCVEVALHVQGFEAGGYDCTCVKLGPFVLLTQLWPRKAQIAHWGPKVVFLMFFPCFTVFGTHKMSDVADTKLAT